MNMHRRILLSMFGLAAVASLNFVEIRVASAADSIIYVNGQAPSGGNGQDWAQAFRTLQEALSAVSGPTQIWIAAGIYTPGTTPSDSFNVPDQTSIYGGFAGNEQSLAQRDPPANPTILSGDLLGNDVGNRGDPVYASSRTDNAYHVVTIASGATVTLDGLTVTGGYADGTLSDPSFAGTGAGIYVSSEGIDGIGTDIGLAYLTLRNIVVSHNDATGRDGGRRTGWGGGLWQLFGTLLVDQSTFTDNFAPDMGGALVAGNFAFNSVMDSIIVTNSAFTSNQTNRSSLGWGAGTFQARASAFDIEGDVFSSNIGNESTFQIGYRGGTNTLNRALIANNVFDHNRASPAFGAALEIFSGVAASTGEPIFTVSGNTFAQNEAEPYGGAMFVSGRGDFLLDGNTFTHNAAGRGGGAIYIDSATGSVKTRNCQFVQNAVTGDPFPLSFMNFQAGSGFFFSPALLLGGGAMAIDDVSNVEVSNSSFIGNRAARGGAISVPGYSWYQDPEFNLWNFSQGLPDFSQLVVETTRPASVTILDNSTFRNNVATTGDGGAVFSGAVITPAVPFANGTFPALTAFGPTAASVTAGIFQQNMAGANGGAISGEGTTATVARSAFFKNTANGAGDHAYFANAVVNTYSSTNQGPQALQSLLSTNSFSRPAGSSGIALQ